VFDYRVTMGRKPGPLREYWIRVRIDGVERVMSVVAVSAQAAVQRFQDDLHRGGRLTYPTATGDVLVEWSNVATLEVGAIVRIVRISADDR
jgi:hypothetical protein